MRATRKYVVCKYVKVASRIAEENLFVLQILWEREGRREWQQICSMITSKVCVVPSLCGS